MDTSLITSDPAVMMGKPVVAGTRLTVEFILDELAAGTPVEQLVASHPQLTPAAVSAALAFAAGRYGPTWCTRWPGGRHEPAG